MGFPFRYFTLPSSPILTYLFLRLCLTLYELFISRIENQVTVNIHYQVIRASSTSCAIAQIKPANSLATAVTTFPFSFPLDNSRKYFL